MCTVHILLAMSVLPACVCVALMNHFQLVAARQRPHYPQQRLFPPPPPLLTPQWFAQVICSQAERESERASWFHLSLPCRQRQDVDAAPGSLWIYSRTLFVWWFIYLMLIRHDGMFVSELRADEEINQINHINQTLHLL